MSKIICDICGTRYPDSSEQCPICGYVRDAENEPQEEVQAVEEFEIPARPKVPGGRFSKANVRKRNQNQPVYEEPVVSSRAVAEEEEEDDYDYDDDYEEETGKKSGTVLNVLLVIVIIALLGVSAYIFVEFFMPNFLSRDPGTTPTESYVQQTEEVTEAPTELQEETQPTEPQEIACEQLVLDVSEIVLREVGEAYLLNVQVLPEGTTDGIMYISSNEEVATVNEEGRVTAVGEGSVVISILCGQQQLECNVVCQFGAEETEAPTETPTEAPTESSLKNVKLGVKVTDTTLRSRGQQSQIKLTCDLDIQDVTWTSQNADVASVNEKGLITRVGAGTTKIIGTYGDQTVEIIVRCPKG